MEFGVQITTLRTQLSSILRKRRDTAGRSDPPTVECPGYRGHTGNKIARVCHSPLAERALRCVADRPEELSVRWLRCRPGRRAAAIYSLIESAKPNALNPQHYIADLLARIADHPARRNAELLPWNWQPLEPPALQPEAAHSPSATPPRRHPSDLLAHALSGRLLGFAGDRKVPAAANSNKPEPEAEDRTGNRRRGRREPQRGADHDDGRTGQGGDGVKIGAQDGGDLASSTSRVMPPPIPVSMPRSAAMTGWSPKASAFCVPAPQRAPAPRRRTAAPGCAAGR